MIESLVQKSAVSASDLEKISQFTRREMSPEELYVFNVTLCNNDIDRDGEKFSLSALESLAELFVGKTGISDHSMKSSDQKARIFDVWVEKADGALTLDGEPFYSLKAKAYMLNNDDNRALIDEIDAGIKKEVSVSCSMGRSICSICGKDKRTEGCEHRNGKSYNGKLCYTILDDARDAYEFSFVAVPAQRQAGVTKSFVVQENCDMENIIKTISGSDDEVTLTKPQVKKLASYIDSLKEEAGLAEDYKNQLSAEVVSLFAKSVPNMDKKLFASITSVMTTKELIGFRDGMRMDNRSDAVKPQLAPKEERADRNYSQFRI